MLHDMSSLNEKKVDIWCHFDAILMFCGVVYNIEVDRLYK